MPLHLTAPGPRSRALLARGGIVDARVPQVSGNVKQRHEADVMKWIVGSMKWIMLVSGALTCTMLYATIAPQAALQGTFGDSLEGPVAEIVVRNWGMLIGLMGAMLIYGAFNIAARPLVLTVAGLSKVTFIALILMLGRPFLGQQAGIAVVSDVIQVSLFVGYLLSVGSSGKAAV